MKIAANLDNISDLIYTGFVGKHLDAERQDKPLLVLHGEIRTPPMSEAARIEAGYRLRLVQKGERLSMPLSRPMPNIGPGCHELRISDRRSTWRIIYHIGSTAIVVLEIFQKKTNQTPARVVDDCKRRLRRFQTDLEVPND